MIMGWVFGIIYNRIVFAKQLHWLISFTMNNTLLLLPVQVLNLSVCLSRLVGRFEEFEKWKTVDVSLGQNYHVDEILAILHKNEITVISHGLNQTEQNFNISLQLTVNRGNKIAYYFTEFQIENAYLTINTRKEGTKKAVFVSLKDCDYITILHKGNSDYVCLSDGGCMETIVRPEHQPSIFIRPNEINENDFILTGRDGAMVWELEKYLNVTFKYHISPLPKSPAKLGIPHKIFIRAMAGLRFKRNDSNCEILNDTNM